MSQANVELLRRGIDEMNRVGLSEANVGLLNVGLYYHPEVAFLPRRSATEGTYHGTAGIESFIVDTREVFEKFEMHCDFLDLGERVLAWGVIHVRARASGIETDIATGGVYDFRDGKIVRWEDFGDKNKALKAVGLEE
ncbi:MAG TPA: nuclear transport factor 2 family protein [Solirubrobacteraceae bacterium]|nr:nuclear transport factor 2 family protein [Solirubrobacteraceae bacterium]